MILAINSMACLLALSYMMQLTWAQVHSDTNEMLEKHSETSRYLRKGINIETLGSEGELDSLEGGLAGFGGFCLFCAIATLLCGCIENNEESKRKSYRGSVVCFILFVIMIILCIVFPFLADDDTE